MWDWLLNLFNFFQKNEPASSPQPQRHINQAGLDLIKSCEGLELEAYPDPASPLAAECHKHSLKLTAYNQLPNWTNLSGDPWTIGFGDTGPDVKPGLSINEAQAEERLRKKLEKFERDVQQAVTIPLSDNQFSALVSFVYNCGLTNFKNSTLLKKLLKKDYQGASLEFAKWVKAGGKVLPGLVDRRAKEKQLFLT